MSPEEFPLLAATISFAGLVGVFVGSFLNVVVYRAPLGLSVSSPRSFCPTCRRQLTWWENVPVVSWLALKGRCRTCHVPISIRYPLVELSTGVIFALVTWAWHGNIVAAAYCCLAATMTAIGLIEYGGQRSPLSVAALGTVTAQAIIVVGAGVQGHWRIVEGSLIGTSIAVISFTLLRSADPDCRDPRGHGRTSLLVAGCWIGGLGLWPAVVGAGVWIVTYLVCMTGAWSLARQTAGWRPRVGRCTTSPADSEHSPGVRDRRRLGCVPLSRWVTNLRWLHESASTRRMVAYRHAGDTFAGPAGVVGTRRVVVVDDHELLTGRYPPHPRGCGGLSVVGEAGDGETALEVIAATTPDLVLVDIRLPDHQRDRSRPSAGC